MHQRRLEDPFLTQELLPRGKQASAFLIFPGERTVWIVPLVVSFRHLAYMFLPRLLCLLLISYPQPSSLVSVQIPTHPLWSSTVLVCKSVTWSNCFIFNFMKIMLLKNIFSLRFLSALTFYDSLFSGRCSSSDALE